MNTLLSPLLPRKRIKVGQSIHPERLVDMKKCIDATPQCHNINGKVIAFLGSHSGMFIAYDLLENQMLWRQTLPDRIESSACVSDEWVAAGM
jgi:hypothetical protein